MINSELTTTAVKRLAWTIIVASLFGLAVVGGYCDSEAANIYDNVESAYCERVQAGTHRHYNENIDCKTKG